MRREKLLSLLFFASLPLSVSVVRASQAKWKVYTPPDKRFSVELPWKPNYQRRTVAGRIGPLPGPTEGITSVDRYDLRISEPNTSCTIDVYTVIDRDPSQEFEKKRSQTATNSYFVRDEAVEVNGLKGRHYIYKKGKVASRYLILFAEHTVYTVTFYTEGDKGIERGAVNKIFDTFRPTP